jgi:hypothetical protein
MQSPPAARKMNDEKNRIYRLELALPKRTYLASYPQKLCITQSSSARTHQNKIRHTAKYGGFIYSVVSKLNPFALNLSNHERPNFQPIVASKATCTLIERKNPTPQTTHSVQVLRKLLRGSLNSRMPAIRITVPMRISISDV